MTNDEAIYTLKNTAWLGSEEQAEKVSEAVQMAVEALKAQLTEKDTTSDCVSRQAAIDAILEMNTEHRVSWLDCAIDTLDTLPSVQPEIVRCKDCKWKQGAECVRFADVRPFADDFCSRAERRTYGTE